MRSIDIFPTIADILDTNIEINEKRGLSLLPLFKGKTLIEQSVMIESIPNSPKSVTTNTIGIRTSKFKYFRDRIESTKNVHLFDLIKDPLEETNIAEFNPSVIENMENELSKIKKDKNFLFKQEKSNNENENKIIEDELKKLGYI